MSRLTDMCAHLAFGLDIAVHGILGHRIAFIGLIAVAQQPFEVATAVVIAVVLVAIVAIQAPPMLRWSARRRVTPQPPVPSRPAPHRFDPAVILAAVDG